MEWWGQWTELTFQRSDIALLHRKGLGDLGGYIPAGIWLVHRIKTEGIFHSIQVSQSIITLCVVIKNMAAACCFAFAHCFQSCPKFGFVFLGGYKPAHHRCEIVIVRMTSVSTDRSNHFC